MIQTNKLLAALVLVASTACGVPIRYAVPAHELAGREVFSAPVRIGEGGDFETYRVLAVDPAETVAPVESWMPNAEKLLQASLPKEPLAEAIVTTDDVRTWPSIIGAVVLGQLGMLVGAAAQGNSNSTSNNGDLTAVGTGTALGVFAGIALGSMLSGRVKTGHFVGPAQRAAVPPAADAPPPPLGPLPLPAAYTPVGSDGGAQP
jgi:hypothetical protein